MKNIFSAVTFIWLAATAYVDPQITSWFTLDAGKFAQIYRTDAD